MKEITIKKLAYLLNQAKNNNQPKPIFFLGAGASASGDIPLASKIVENILEKYSDSPFLEDLNEQEKSSYPKLMECLLPDQRNQLLKEYIDKAKINVTHIYLAQLLSEGYADYILTVNFDNLMLRALALYNIFPSTYDMAILKDLTTTKFKEKSVVYLHGQHHGLWLLNTPSEMEKVKDIIPRIFDSIKDKRPWIFIGYSGNDPIFEHIKNLGRFDNGLYWLAYKDNEPESNVVEFLKESNVNASILKGYDSDSFMIKLNEALNLPQPQILDKPFSSLKNMLNVITDIDDKDHFRGVKDRLDMARNNVGKAIKQFEDGDVNVVTKEELNIDIIKKEIIDIIISSKYNNDQVQKLEEKVKPLNNSILNELLGELYFNWGNTFDKQVDVEKKLNTDKSILLKAISKYKKSEQISPKNNILYLNWGLSIARLALCEESETKKEKLYSESIEKLKLSIKIFSYYYTYFCLGTVISNYANTQKGKKAENLYKESFEIFEKAIELNSKSHEVYNNWGRAISNLALISNNDKSEILYRDSINKYKLAIEIKPDYNNAYNNWATTLGYIAKSKIGEESKLLVKEAIDKFEKGIELGSNFYNYACILAINGEREKALKYLIKSLKRGEVESLYVRNDKDWEKYWDDIDFKNIISKYEITEIAENIS